MTENVMTDLQAGDLVEPTEGLDYWIRNRYADVMGPPPWQILNLSDQMFDSPNYACRLRKLAISLMPRGVMLSGDTRHLHCRWANGVDIIQGDEALPTVHEGAPLVLPFRKTEVTP